MQENKIRKFYHFFFQIYLLILLTEFLSALLNQSCIQFFFDRNSPFPIGVKNQHIQNIFYGIFLMFLQFSSLLANLFWGWISDRIGRKFVAFISLFSIFVTSLVTIYSANNRLLSLFIFGYIIGQLLYGIFPISISAISSINCNNEEKLFWISLLQFFTGLSFFIGSYLSSWIMSHYGNFIIPSYIVLYSSLIFIIFCMCNCKSEIFFSKNKICIRNNSFIFLKQKKLLMLIFLLLLDQITWGIFFQFIQPIVKVNFHYSINSLGSLVSFIGFSLMFSSLILLPFLQKIFSRHIIYLMGLSSMFFSALGIIFVIFFDLRCSFYLYFFTFLMASGDMIIFSLLIVSCLSLIPLNRQGMASGLLYTLSKGFGWGIAGIIGGFFMSFSSISLMLIALLILIICFTFYLFFSSKLNLIN